MIRPIFATPAKLHLSDQIEGNIITQSALYYVPCLSVPIFGYTEFSEHLLICHGIRYQRHLGRRCPLAYVQAWLVG